MKKFRLQLLAEGAPSAGAEGASSEVAVGENGEDLSKVVYGREEQLSKDNQVPPDVSEEDESNEGESFEELIKTKFKEEFDSKVKDIIQKRFKNQNEVASKYQQQLDKLSPVLTVLGAKYGFDVTDMNNMDFDKLSNAVLNDKTILEQEALAKGMEPETYMEVFQANLKAMQADQILEQQRQEAARQEQFEALMHQAEEVKEIYPSFDLGLELQDEQFGKLVASGVPVRTAYEACHIEEIQAGLMQYTAAKAKKEISSAIQANGKRAIESGAQSQSPVIAKTDVSKLSEKDYEEIRKRVLEKGERIAF